MLNATTRDRVQRLLYLKSAVQLVWRSSPGLTVASGILLLLQSGLPLVVLLLTKQVIDTLTISLNTPEPLTRLGVTLQWIVLGAIALLFNNLCGALAEVVREAQSQAVIDYVQTMLHTKSVDLDLAYYENARYYDALHQAQQDAPYRPITILEQLLQLGQSAVSLGAIAILLATVHWAIIILLFVAVLPGLWLRLKAARQLYEQWQEWTPQERQAEYLSWILTHHSHAKEVRLFSLGPLLQDRFQRLRQRIRRRKVKLAIGRGLADWVIQSSATLAMTGAWGFLVWQTLSRNITLGSLVMYYQAFQQGQDLLRQGLGSLAVLYENSLFLSHFYTFMGLEQTLADPRHPRSLPQVLTQGIEFKQVEFAYPYSQRQVLQQVSFKITAGETIALVGQNGAGKTSLVKLLSRLYDPAQGQILLDGIDIREFSLTDFRRQVRVVFQDYVHYDLTVRENIGFGYPPALTQPERIQQAAAAAGAESLINRLPKGYETILGNLFEDGEELSVGEWQKLAIARAFLHPALIMILDEPTSALDADAEFEVLEQFRQLVRDRTAILISHRLSTVKMADRIFVLENGRITEGGTHQELMSLRGTYFRMFETQAQQYR
jgi:ATP-binding cassette, subfamily B, bacterial